MSRVFDYSGVPQDQDNHATYKVRLSGRRAMDRVFSGQHQAIPFSIRFISYAVVILLIFQSIALFIQHKSAATLFSENGILEWLQILILLSCALLIHLVATRLSDIRDAARLISFLPLLACVRELDDILDTYVADSAWQIIATALILYLLYYALLHRHTIKGQFLKILAFPCTGLFLAGFLTVMIFSRLFGQQNLWQLALQENYIRLVPRMVEEGCELFGYLLLLFACIELLIFAVSCKYTPISKPHD